MIRHLAAPAGGALALLLAISPAHAQTAKRAWVSGHGTDAAGCGAPTAPCRSLQYTHDHIVAAGGEIDILDPAGYGAITINKAISIINDGVGTAGVQTAFTTAIVVSAAGGDAVRLRGLNIEGVGSAVTGVAFVTGASLVIENSSIDGFTGQGVAFIADNGASSLYISNTTLTNCGAQAVSVTPLSPSSTVQVTLEHVEAIHDGTDGLLVDGRGALPGATVTVILADSVISGMTNGVHGVSSAGHPPVLIMVRNTVLDSNGVAVVSEPGATIDVGHSTIAGNTLAYFIGSGANLGSYGDNIVDGNVLASPTPTPLSLQ